MIKKAKAGMQAKKVISKALAKDAYISKDQLVIMLLEALKEEFNITKFIGDAHYGSAIVMQWCKENGIEALAKIPRNRKILSRRWIYFKRNMKAKEPFEISILPF